MSRYDGLIIPRSYSEYINKTDAATLQQALQLSGVMDAAPTADSVNPVKSGGVFTAIQNNSIKIKSGVARFPPVTQTGVQELAVTFDTALPHTPIGIIIDWEDTLSTLKYCDYVMIKVGSITKNGFSAITSRKRIEENWNARYYAFYYE